MGMEKKKEKHSTYRDSLYLEVDRKLYENKGIIEIIGEYVLSGRELCERVLEEEYGENRNTVMNIHRGFDIVSPNRLNDLLRCVGGKSGEIAGYFILHRDGYNMLRITLKRISNATGASLPTVNKVIKNLKKHDLIRRGIGGEYMISPYLTHRGKLSRAAYLIKMYERLNVIGTPVIPNDSSKKENS